MRCVVVIYDYSSVPGKLKMDFFFQVFVYNLSSEQENIIHNVRMKDLVCQGTVAEVGESTTPRAPPIRQAFFWTKDVEGLTIVTSTFLSMPKKKKIR